MTANAKNLSTLANVLDDGTNGQFLQSTGSGGIVFADVAAGASVYDSAELLPLSGNDAGDMAYVNSTNRFYINNGTGWYSISLVNTNPNITSVQDASSNTTPFTLATDGTATVITITANDPEQVPLTYNYSVTSGSLTNGGGTTATVTQSDNVFTVTPSTTEAYAGTFSLTFTASDGINTATSANSFTLEFITIVTDSNYTTLLATATDTSDNNNIADASSNNHSITVTGDAYAGTFSPYRSGGYSTYFDGAGDYIDTGLNNVATDFTFECWVNTTVGGMLMARYQSGSALDGFLIDLTSGFPIIQINENTNNLIGTVNLKDGKWHHLAFVRDNNVCKIFVDGTLDVSQTDSEAMQVNANWIIGRHGNNASYYYGGYIRDLRWVAGTVRYTGNFTPPTEPLTTLSGDNLFTCHLPYIIDGSATPYTMTSYGNVSTKPFSPYDYNEYSAADHGGSVYFDGTGDTLEIPHSTNVGAFGTNDFTVQLWYYTDAANSQDYLIDFRQYGGNGDYLSIFKNGSNKIVVAEGGSNRITGTKDISVGQWFFITVHRDNGSLKLFVNGEQDGSTYSDSTNYVAGSSGNFIIGKNNGTASYLMEGYLSDIKVTHGSALDGTTVPTAPLSSSGADLHIKGTDASIIDKSQSANLKLIGDTTGSTTQVKFSNTKSMYFDGTGDYLTTGNNSNLNLGTGALTVELWYYLTNSQTHTLFELHDGYPNGGGTLYTNNRAKMAITSTKILLNDGTANVGDYAETQVINQWRHWAWSRDASGNNRFYLNGTQIGTTTSSSNNLITPVVDLGRRAETDSTYMQGYIQDFRITKGLARYTANFTPPTASLEG